MTVAEDVVGLVPAAEGVAGTDYDAVELVATHDTVELDAAHDAVELVAARDKVTK